MSEQASDLYYLYFRRHARPNDPEHFFAAVHGEARAKQLVVALELRGVADVEYGYMARLDLVPSDVDEDDRRARLDVFDRRLSELEEELRGLSDHLPSDRKWPAMKEVRRLKLLALWTCRGLEQVHPVSHPLAASSGPGEATSKPDTSDWLTVSQAARDAGVNKGIITRDCSLGKIHSEGTGRARRINPSSFKVWRQNRERGGEVRAALGDDSPAQDKPQISSGLCQQCGYTVTLRDGVGECPKCKSSAVDPL